MELHHRGACTTNRCLLLLFAFWLLHTQCQTIVTDDRISYNLQPTIVYKAADVFSEPVASGSRVDVQGSPYAVLNVAGLQLTRDSWQGAHVKLSNLSITNASLGVVPAVPVLNITTMREHIYQDDFILPPPAPEFLRLPWLPSANVELRSVELVTDCTTLVQYQNYLCGGKWTSDIQINASHIIISSWRSSTTLASDVTLTCHSPDGLGASGWLTSSGCAIATVSDAQQLADSLELQNQGFKQLVAVLTANITLDNEGAWADEQTPKMLNGTLVLAGAAQLPVVLDLKLRQALLQLARHSGVLEYNITTSGMGYGARVQEVPPYAPDWGLGCGGYVLYPSHAIEDEYYLFRVNTTMLLATDFSNYLGAWFGKSLSASVILQKQAAWTAILAVNNVAVFPSPTAVFVNVTDMPALGRMKDSWELFGAEVPQQYSYTGYMEVTNQAVVPLTQMGGASNSSTLVAQMQYYEGVPNLVSGTYTIVILANISFQGLGLGTQAAEVANGNATRKNGSTLLSSIQSPVVVSNNVIWGPWAFDRPIIDFAYRRDLFQLTQTGTITLLNLTLTGLPCRCDGTLLGLWGAALWPFNNPRDSSTFLSLKSVTLMVTRDEIDFLEILLNYTKGVASQSSSSTAQVGLGWLQGRPLLLPFGNGTNASEHVGESWQFLSLDGLGYETDNITMVPRHSSTNSSTNASSGARDFITNSASLAMFESLYNLRDSASGGNDLSASDDDGSSNGWIGIVLGVVLGCTALAVVVLVVAVFWTKKKRQQLEKERKDLSNKRSSFDPCDVTLMMVKEGTESGKGDAQSIKSQSVKSQPQSPPQAATGMTSKACSNVEDIFDAVARRRFGALKLDMEKLLAQGSTAKVYLAHWRGLPVAVKVMPLPSAGEVARVAREVGVLMSVSHPNIIATYHYVVQEEKIQVTAAPSRTSCNGTGTTMSTGEAADNGNMSKAPSEGTGSGGVVPGAQTWNMVYIVQEYCDCGTLRDAIDGVTVGEGGGCAPAVARGPTGGALFKDTDGAPVWHAILQAAGDIALALHHLHTSGIVHGDVTPNNILMKSAPELGEDGVPLSCWGGFKKWEVKVADFGLSIILTTQQTHKSNVEAGTMFYVAPEVLMEGQLGKAADVFALGIIMWELYHGTPPWRKRRMPPALNTNTLLVFDSACPQAYVELCQACMHENPQDRPPLEEVLTTLKAIRDAHIDTELIGEWLPPKSCKIDMQSRNGSRSNMVQMVPRYAGSRYGVGSGRNSMESKSKEKIGSDRTIGDGMGNDSSEIDLPTVSFGDSTAASLQWQTNPSTSYIG